MSDDPRQHLRRLPGVDRVIRDERLAPAVAAHGLGLVTFVVRECIDRARAELLEDGRIPDCDRLIADAQRRCRELAEPSLRPVINATGIVLHTNMGRAPLGETLLQAIGPVASGYTNLELDLADGRRGDRNTHLDALLRFVTGAEDALVVNNNAAAMMLALGTLAKGREVIVSRGELIEIGGSFRLPDILTEAGAKLVEVGTTNRTRVADYERAITDQTALLLKAHRSNFAVTGFTEEPSLESLVALGRARGLPVMYDLGSGLLRKPANLPLADEPDVAGTLASGIDLLTFSGDKLLGGPQSGIIVGRRALVERMRRAPLFRALRVCKLTIAALAGAVRAYLDDQHLCRDLPIFAMLSTLPATLEARAARLKARLSEHGIAATTTDSTGRCGGGTLPGLVAPSFAVAVTPPDSSREQRSRFAERLHQSLLHAELPVLGVLRQGEILLDVLTIAEADLDRIAKTVAQAVKSLPAS